VLNYLFENNCLLCDKEVSPLRSLCENCEEKVLKKGPSFYREVHRKYELFVYSDYTDEIERIIRLYKYHGEVSLSGTLVKLFLKLYSYFPREANLITWVPSSLDSLENRGFDHMRLLAKRMSKELGIPFDAVLENVSEGRQVEKSKEERKRTGRFICKKDPPQNVILIDDVLTTGTSVRDCVETLFRNGVSKVFVYVLAKTRR
jgi:competence protein ComFC